LKTQDADLHSQLNTLTATLGFQLLVLVSFLFSFRANTLERDYLQSTLSGGDKTPEPNLFPFRCRSSALSVGTAGFFFSDTLRTLQQAEGRAARRSAELNALAGFLVLAAAVIRLIDVVETEQSAPALEEELLPD
jgi:hypothetical protein